MAKISSPRRARTNSSPSARPDIMLPSPRSLIGNPFLKSGLFVSGVAAMICLLSQFRYCSRFKILAVIETDGSVHITRELREFLKHREARGYFASRNRSPFAPRSSPETRQASLHEQTLHNSVLLMRFGTALHDNQRQISQ